LRQEENQMSDCSRDGREGKIQRRFGIALFLRCSAIATTVLAIAEPATLATKPLVGWEAEDTCKDGSTPTPWQLQPDGIAVRVDDNINCSSFLRGGVSGSYLSATIGPSANVDGIDGSDADAEGDGTPLPCHTVALTPCEAPSPYFGGVNEITENRLVSGYTGDDWANPLDDSCESGAVHVFKSVAGGWFLDQKITASDGQCDDSFGTSIDWDGTRLIVGAQNYGYDNQPPQNEGGAYVYSLQNGWSLESRLPHPSEAELRDFFGKSVAIDGDWAAVGAPASPPAPNGPGAVYLYHWSGAAWVEHAMLTASDGEVGENFGFSVSLSGDWLAIGANRTHVPEVGGNYGAVYVFHYDGAAWAPHAKLQAPEEDTLPGRGAFGNDVDVRGTRIVVGAPAFWGASEPVRSGVVYVYGLDAGSWALNARLVDASASEQEEFGTTVQTDGDRIVAGGPQKDHPVLNGTVIVFRKVAGQWVVEHEARDPDGNLGRAWGNGVAIRGDLIAAGATHGIGGTGQTPGFVHLIDLVGARCEEVPPACCLDGDDDGYGFPGHFTCGGGATADCNDADASIHPGAFEVCNHMDDDCDGLTDEDYDSDTDGYSVCEGDCDDGSPEAWATPGEVHGLAFGDDKVTLSWLVPLDPGGILVYDTLRSSSAADFVTEATCVETDDGTDTLAIDTDLPGSGEIFSYLIRAENACPYGQGPFGNQSNGSPRTGRQCP